MEIKGSQAEAHDYFKRIWQDVRGITYLYNAERELAVLDVDML